MGVSYTRNIVVHVKIFPTVSIKEPYPLTPDDVDGFLVKNGGTTP
jgi:hypothetical protein